MRFELPMIQLLVREVCWDGLNPVVLCRSHVPGVGKEDGPEVLFLLSRRAADAYYLAEGLDTLPVELFDFLAANRMLSGCLWIGAYVHLHCSPCFTASLMILRSLPIEKSRPSSAPLG